MSTTGKVEKQKSEATNKSQKSQPSFKGDDGRS